MIKYTFNFIVTSNAFKDGDTFRSDVDGMQYSKYFLKYIANVPGSHFKMMNFTFVG